MGHDGRVAWREGLFLRPQHFQQQDRFIDGFVRARTEALRPYPWGLVSLTLDDSLTSLGKFGVSRCVGALPDGTPFAIPGDGPPPAPIEIPADTRDAVVYLTLPALQTGLVEFAERSEGGKAVAARHLVDEEEVHDAFAEERVTEQIEIAYPNLRYGAAREQTEGRVCLGVARVREVINGQVQLDERYIPPCLDIRASDRLSGFLRDILGRTEVRADELAQYAVDTSAGGAEGIASMIMLQALNRWLPILRHLQALPLVHPERLYEVFTSMSGELATLVIERDGRRAPIFAAYDHEDLQTVFEEVYAKLQDQLSAVFERAAGILELEEFAPRSYRGAIEDHGLFRNCDFYLAVSARRPLEEVRGKFPDQVKIGPVQRMRQLVRAATAGVALAPTPSPPPQLRVMRGYVYFELDRSGPDWRDLASSPGIGLHVAGEWPDLKLQLWWVKRS